MKKTIYVLCLCIILSLFGCACKHEWKEATCTSPKTCEKCGETEGEPLGHAWEEATCTEPSKCERCGETQGDPLGHDGIWETVSVDVVSAKQTEKCMCKTCKEELESREEDIGSFVKDGAFIFSPEEFIQRLQTKWDHEVEMQFKYAITSSGKISCDIENKHGVWFGWVLFYDKNGKAIDDGAEDRTIYSIRVIVPKLDDMELSTARYLFQLLAPYCAATVDPTIKDISIYKSPILDNLYAFNSKPLNGIYYSLALDSEDEYFYMDIDIAE